MRLLLDTNVLIRLRTSDRKLWKEHRRAAEQAGRSGERIGVAAITLWEIAKLHADGVVRLGADIRSVLDDIGASGELQVLPITPQIAFVSTQLGNAFPRDPADQLIAATALVHGLKLVTSDEAIRESGAVAVV